MDLPSLPPSDHAVWKLLQALVALAGLAIVVTHGVEGGHLPGVDTEDVSGVVGLVAGANLVRQWIKG